MSKHYGNKNKRAIESRVTTPFHVIGGHEDRPLFPALNMGTRIGKKQLNFHHSMNEKLRKTSKKNAKQNKGRVAGFAIPALQDAFGFNSCGYAGACQFFCYGLQGMFVMKQSRIASQNNLDVIKRFLDIGDYKTLTSLLASDIGMLPSGYQYYRIHTIGDFFSTEYYDVWADVMKQFPKMKFYAYTKNIPLALNLYHNIGMPKNFSLVQSVGGTCDDMIDEKLSHSIVFPTDEMRLHYRYLPGDNTDLYAIQARQKIGLVYHGSNRTKIDTYLTQGQYDAMIKASIDIAERSA
jgi:hypothetical protein